MDVYRYFSLKYDKTKGLIVDEVKLRGLLFTHVYVYEYIPLIYREDRILLFLRLNISELAISSRTILLPSPADDWVLASCAYTSSLRLI